MSEDRKNCRPMSLQVLLATMGQEGISFLSQMNVDSDAFVVNQTDHFSYWRGDFRGHEVTIMSMKERGVGLSRNTSLDRAEADLALFADDDLVYYNGYEQIVKEEFERLSAADVIIFNLDSADAGRSVKQIQNSRRLRLSAAAYGMPRVAVRTGSVRAAGVRFSLLFGGGAKYSAGEDSIFLAECVRKGLKVYTSPLSLGRVSFGNSSWYEGINKKYLHDRGALFYALSRLLWPFLILRFAVRHKSRIPEHIGQIGAIRLMWAGASEFRRQ